MDSDCDDYYNSDEHNEFEEEQESNDTEQNKNNYTVLKVADIHERVMENIDTVSSFLSIPKEAARILLLDYKWTPSQVEEAWFSYEDKIRKSLGLLLDKPVKLPKYKDTDMITCTICYEEKRAGRFCGTVCGHAFCVTCWTRYIETSIGDGPRCLSLRCPEHKCRVIVKPDQINLVCGEDRNKYYRILVQSYVDGGNGKIKWCPSPGCEYAVEFEGDGTFGYEVTCGCSNKFCWNCLEDSHRPMECNMVAKWMTKGKAEAENTTWVLAYTKPCPKCKRSIEKNAGCMHMTCGSHCRFEFCWLCLQPWTEHKDYYNCNKYQQAKKEGTYDNEEATRKMAENSIIKYTHYYERWINNDKSRKKAIKDLTEMNLDNLTKLEAKLSKTVTELVFITEAWVQIVECRRALKWTYAYGYYIPEEELAKKHFFEYLQGEAEAALERLHYCAETELGCFLKDTSTETTDLKVTEKLFADFDNYSVKLKDLTSVTGTYFENLVKALENGLREVGSTTV